MLQDIFTLQKHFFFLVYFYITNALVEKFSHLLALALKCTLKCIKRALPLALVEKFSCYRTYLRCRNMAIKAQIRPVRRR